MRSQEKYKYNFAVFVDENLQKTVPKLSLSNYSSIPFPNPSGALT
jgi:hypothetical protein